MPTEDNGIDSRALKLSSIATANGHETKHLQIEIKADTEKRLISGYASTFDGWDSYHDTIVKGAFARTIREKHAGREASAIKFLWQHKWAEPLGLPVVLEEDSRGLVFEAKVVEPGDLGRRALTFAAEKVVDGLSIGFDVFPGGSEWVDPAKMSTEELAGLLASGATLDDLYWMPPRRLSAIDLWEVSLVTFPANTDARVEVVKSLARVLVPGWRPSQKSDAAPAPAPAPAPTPPTEEAKAPEAPEAPTTVNVHLDTPEAARAFAAELRGRLDLTHPESPAEVVGDEPPSPTTSPLAGLAADMRSLNNALR